MTRLRRLHLLPIAFLLACTVRPPSPFPLPVPPPIPPPVVVPPDPPPLPDPLTREQALAVHLSFQGLTCHTDQFGDEPYFPASLAWHDAASRQQIYACLTAAGDTHTILHLPNGVPLYDECCQFYSPDKFPALDWTQGETTIDPAFTDLVIEVRRAGLRPIVTMDERMAHAQRLGPLVAQALMDAGLAAHVALILPGYDGVFYGWEPSAIVIPQWFQSVRAICPDCRLGLEFNIGHLPHEGHVDLSDVDALLIEFNDRDLHDNNTFGILERLIGPAYRRPADDAPPRDGGDGHPRPWLPHDTPRGLRQTVCFEWATYEWVRAQTTTAAVAAQRAWLVSLGCPAIG